MEYYPPGNLQKYLEASPCQEQPWARDVIRQVLGVLIELETSQMAHRNLTLSVCPHHRYSCESGNHANLLAWLEHRDLIPVAHQGQSYRFLQRKVDV